MNTAKHFTDRCNIAAACLPRDEYRASLERLHAEMLAALDLGMPLTDSQITSVLESAGVPELPPEWASCDYEIARAVERAHGIFAATKGKP